MPRHDSRARLSSFSSSSSSSSSCYTSKYIHLLHIKRGFGKGQRSATSDLDCGSQRLENLTSDVWSEFHAWIRKLKLCRPIPGFQGLLCVALKALRAGVDYADRRREWLSVSLSSRKSIEVLQLITAELSMREAFGAEILSRCVVVAKCSQGGIQDYLHILDR
jgi:hypothetical protein